MIRITNSIEIHLPVSRVFPYVADFTNNPQWQPVVSVTRLTNGPLGVGTRFKQQFRLMDEDHEMDCVLTEFEVNRKIAFDYESKLFAWRGAYEFTPTANGTQVSARGTISLQGPYKVGETLFAPRIRKLINDTAPRLKQVLEAGPQPKGARELESS